MMSRLEDDFCDIIAKARCGHGLTCVEAAAAAGLVPARLAELEKGARPQPDEILSLCRLLELHAPSLTAIADGRWKPNQSLPPGVYMPPPAAGYAANSWLVETGQKDLLDIVDPGAEPERLLACMTGKRLRLILLTHAHADHIGAVEDLQRARGGIVCLHSLERAAFSSFGPEQAEALGWKAIELPGHTAGSVAWLRQGCLFCGDAVFAGSIGRSFHCYAEHLFSLRQKVLVLPPQTLLLPGHGPLSSVWLESRHNPFLADMSQTKGP